MGSFWGHLNTVVSHKRLVFYHARKIGIPYRGFVHDMSKFLPCELFAGAKYYAAGKRSPNEIQRETFGYSSAWLHHKGVNKHHFEYWTDYSPTERRIMPVKMPYVYLLEMFCDRVAASKVYQGKNYTDSHPADYFLKGKEKRSIHPETSDALEELLMMLKEKGEDYTFSYIRKNRKKLEMEYNGKRSDVL